MKASKVTLGLALLLGVSAMAQAPEPATTHLDRAYKYDVGTYLVDAAGNTVYVFAGDVDGSTACEGDCLVNWPPVPYADGMADSSGLDAALLGNTESADGTSQATYGGLPLYYFVGDDGVGSIAGQSLGSVWYLVSEAGQPVGANLGQFLAGQSTATVNRAYKYDVGTFLIDGAGFSLYAFTDDADGVSNCEGDCASNWPPLLAGADLAAGAGLDAELLGTIARGAGEQVTYAGQPLYRFIGDEATGNVTGQGLAGKWYLVSADGSLIGQDSADEAAAEAGEAEEAATEAPAEEAAAPDVDPAVMQLGSTVFASATTPSCAACHGENGEGVAGPALAGNSQLDNSERIIRTVLRGGHIMPAFGDQLNDDQVSAVLTFVRNSWGNDFGEITADDVASSR